MRSGRRRRSANSSSASATRLVPPSTSNISSSCCATVRSPTPICHRRPSSPTPTPGSAGATRRGGPPPSTWPRRAPKGSRGRSPARCAARDCSPRAPPALRYFEQALRLHEQTPDAFEQARTRLAYGERLRRARNRVLAREQLRAAADTFERLDARPWADRARAELAATGETRRQRDPSTIDELTPQELQIALLLTTGRTTRETAAALFLSPKTVEYHLRHVYQKLGIHSRDELAQALATQTRQESGQASLRGADT